MPFLSVMLVVLVGVFPVFFHVLGLSLNGRAGVRVMQGQRVLVNRLGRSTVRIGGLAVR